MGKKPTTVKWEMSNGNSSWIWKATMNNIEIIVDYLLKQKSEGKFEFTYKKISKATGLDRRQVQFACQKLAFRIHPKPIIKIVADSYKNKSGSKKPIQLTEKVKLLT